MIPKPIQKHLENMEVDAEAIVHRTVYTAYDLAQTTGANIESIAKTLLLKVEPYVGVNKSKYVIAVLPASHNLDLKKLQKALKVKKLSIPKEQVMTKLYKVKAGALTAFGPVHGDTPVVIDKALMKSKKIIARSGSFTESLLMKAKDFAKATGGELAAFAVKVKRAKPKTKKAVKKPTKRPAKKKIKARR